MSEQQQKSDGGSLRELSLGSLNGVSVQEAGSRRDNLSVIIALFVLFLQAGSATASGNIPLVLYDVWRSKGLPG